MRARAGWFAALIYMICVLAPGTALAFGNAAACSPLVVQPAAAAPEPEEASVQAALHHHHETNEDLVSAQYPEAGHAGHAPGQHRQHGKASPEPCCAVLCLSAIAADMPAVANPASPISALVTGIFQRLPDKAAPLHFRPPIS